MYYMYYTIVFLTSLKKVPGNESEMYYKIYDTYSNNLLMCLICCYHA